MCMGGVLPFVGLGSEGEFEGALRDYREGLGSRSSEFMDLRFDPFDDEVRGALRGLGAAVGGCSYVAGDEVGERLGGFAREGVVPSPCCSIILGVPGVLLLSCWRQR